MCFSAPRSGGLGFDGIRGAITPTGLPATPGNGVFPPGTTGPGGGEGFEGDPLPVRKVRFPRRVSWPSISLHPQAGMAWKLSTRAGPDFGLSAW